MNKTILATFVTSLLLLSSAQAGSPELHGLICNAMT
jgi:hypothetical protein